MTTSLYNGSVQYDSTAKTYTVTTGINTKDLNTLLNSAEKSSTILFGEGKYVLTEAVKVTRGDLTIQGAGEGKTIFESQFTKPDSTFVFTGGYGLSTTVQSSVTAGATSITVSDPSKFIVGNAVRIYEPNDIDFIHQPIPTDLANDPYLSTSMKNAIAASGTLYGNVENQSGMGKSPLRESLTEIVKIEGNTIFFKDPVAYNMNGGQAILQKMNTLDNLKVSDFTIQNNLGAANPTAMVNAQPDWNGTHAIYFWVTRGTEVSNLSIIDSASNGLTATRMYNADVNDITIVGAHNKGGEGNGYGLNIAGSQHSNFNDVTVLDTRHGVLFSSWGTEVDNKIHIIETNRDINFHGGPDMGNVITVDKATSYYYNQVPGSPGTGIVTGMATMHPYTDISQNDVLFHYANGGKGGDVLHGLDTGAYLRGGSGNDVLVGGNGNDVLIGDTQMDTLTGGKGADFFVLTNEISGWGATDTITDFNRADGDKLVFINVNQDIQASDVVFTTVGSDVLVSVTRMDVSALLKNISASQIGLQDIILNTKPYSEDPLYYIFPETQNIPSVDPDKILAPTTSADHLVGGSGNDSLTGYSALFKGDSYDFGSGTDTLFLSGNDIWLRPDTLPQISGLDVIDISYSSTVSRISIDDAMIRQSDSGTLLIKNDNTVISQVISAIKDNNLKLIFESEGDIYLGDRYNNVIYLNEKNQGAVYGGTGRDTIYASTHQDILSGGGGSDVFVLSTNKDGKADIIKDFNVKQDKLDISGLLFEYDPLQNAIDHFIRITSTADGKSELHIDRDGTGTRYNMETAVVFETHLNDQDLIIGNNLIVA